MAKRDDMTVLDALRDCHDSWASGSWPESNASANLDEVMHHLERLFGTPTSPSVEYDEDPDRTTDLSGDPT